MTERIQELCDQARRLPAVSGVFIPDEFVEKFAELIIEDVRSVLSNCYQELPLERAGAILYAEEEILDHFYGAKEKIKLSDQVPAEWHTEIAATSFAMAYNGEGSYYCPDCDANTGSVWYNDIWRPTKFQALCYTCRKNRGIKE